jgi:hypothetical protein
LIQRSCSRATTAEFVGHLAQILVLAEDESDVVGPQVSEAYEDGCPQNEITPPEALRRVERGADGRIASVDAYTCKHLPLGHSPSGSHADKTMALCYARLSPTWIRGVAEGRFFYAAEITIHPEIVGRKAATKGPDGPEPSEPTRDNIRR